MASIFNRKRFSQWRDVLEEESNQSGALALFRSMVWALVTGAYPGRAEWRRRMRTCPGCPVYDRGMKRCRPWTGSPVGCGCFTPFKALVKRKGKGCWGDENIPGFQWGWEATRLHRAFLLL